MGGCGKCVSGYLKKRVEWWVVVSGVNFRRTCTHLNRILIPN